MRHKLSTIVYAQGWLGSQLENLVNTTAEKENEDPTPHLIAAQVYEQWTIIDQAIDDLIKTNQELQRKLSVVESAFK